MKTLLPWLCVIILLAGLAFLYSSIRQKDAELAVLREASREVEKLRAELEQLKASSATQEEEIARLRRDNQELLRLRNEIRQVREEKQQLARQALAAQAEMQRAQAQAQAAQSEVQALRTNAAPPPPEPAPEQKAQACINNLRLLDAAKQRWALEKGKQPNTVPTPQDLAPYLPGNILPACPAQGVYSLNPVGAPPSCSIPGHSLSM